MNQEPFFESGYTPPTAFYFGVKFDGSPDMDSSFQEISGLKLPLGTEQVGEGGNNIYRHELPSNPTFENLVLKRCLVSNSALDKWCRSALEEFLFDPKNLQISLLGENGVLLASWIVDKAFPISWELASLNSASNELAIETLVLKYSTFRMLQSIEDSDNPLFT